jgi:hypothetical protein
MTSITASAPARFRLDLVWWLPRAILLGLLAFVIFGPLANLLIWTVAERWYFPTTVSATGGACSPRAAAPSSR